MGIICVTQENKYAPWLNFEAGAIAKGLSSNKVVPLLIDIKPTDISGSPLTQFQSKNLLKEDIYKLIIDINNSCNRKIPNDKIDIIFNSMWVEFYKQIERIKSTQPTSSREKTKRSSEDIMEEVLLISRGLKSEISSISYMMKTSNIDYRKNKSAYDDIIAFLNDNIRSETDLEEAYKVIYDNYGFSKKELFKIITDHYSEIDGSFSNKFKTFMLSASELNSETKANKKNAQL